MWLPDSIIAEVKAVARWRYVNQAETKLWNEHRREGELRLLTGWEWTARKGDRWQQGLKTETCCIRDAWYALVSESAAPPIARPRLRVVASRKAA